MKIVASYNSNVLTVTSAEFKEVKKKKIVMPVKNRKVNNLIEGLKQLNFFHSSKYVILEEFCSS